MTRRSRRWWNSRGDVVTATSAHGREVDAQVSPCGDAVELRVSNNHHEMDECDGRCTAQRAVVKLDPDVARDLAEVLLLVADQVGTSMVNRPGWPRPETVDATLAFVADHPGTQPSQVAEALGVSRTTAGGALHRLLVDGRHAEMVPGKPYRLRLNRGMTP